MIHLKIKELCQERGITHPVTVLLKMGISQDLVYKYLTGKAKRIPTEHIEKLCVLFGCTPNELFSWTPTTKKDDYPQHPLQAIRHQPATNLQAKLKNMPLDELRRRMEG